MHLVNQLEAALGRLAEWLAWIGMLAMLLMAFHVGINISYRWLTGRDIQMTLEIVTYYYMVALVYLPMAFIDRAGGHIIADLFSGFMTERAVKQMDAVFRILLAAFFGVLFWITVRDAIERTIDGEAVMSAFGPFDIWLSRWSVPIGFGLACPYTLVLAAKNLLDAGAEQPRP
ncbi:MAG: TRAP transporter small permease subunit [Alphaproteobacteria bacterium]|nr:TRAP transporter small permease subunit [Alphaproteobacteria bacterium]